MGRGGGSRGGRHLIAAGDVPHRDGDAVPAVDGDHRERQGDEFLFRELRPHALVEFVRRVILGDQRQRVGPGECGALAVGEEGRFPPGAQAVEALLGFAFRARVLAVHVDAERAAVDDRRPHPHQLEQRVLQRAVPHALLEREHALHLRRVLLILDPWFHDDESSLQDIAGRCARRSRKLDETGHPLVTTRRFEIDPDIGQASTLPSWAYTDPALYARTADRVFARSWQLVADTDRVRVPGWACPVTFAEGILEEPLLLTRDGADRLHCVSNVCTHRGNLVCEHEGAQSVLRCRYHGRRFGLDGRFVSMPEFEGVKDFPGEADHLRALRLESWGKLLFTAIDAHPLATFAEWIAPVIARCGWMPIERAVLDPTRSRDYLVRANWALYCDNYLEGFHIPYVHHGLAGALDYANYRSEVFDWCNLQVGIAAPGEDAFDLPADSPD